MMFKYRHREANRKQKPAPASVAGPASLAFFALILLLIDLTGVHPGLPGRTGAEQIRQLAAQAADWRLVHGAFTVAGLLGLAGVLWLRQFLLQRGPRVVVEPASWVGVLGAVIFTATTFAEVGMIPDLAIACSNSAPCVASDNARFTEAFADAGWRILPGLVYGARVMMAGLTALAVIGLGAGLLRLWEGLPIALGAGYEFARTTGLHGWGRFSVESGMSGLSGVLVIVGAAAILARSLQAPPGPTGDQPPEQPGSGDAAPFDADQPELSSADDYRAD